MGEAARCFSGLYSDSRIRILVISLMQVLCGASLRRLPQKLCGYLTINAVGGIIFGAVYYLMTTKSISKFELCRFSHYL